jgi:hypothetical protein
MSREEKLNYTFTGDPSDDSWRRNPRFGQWVALEVVDKTHRPAAIPGA